MFRSHTFAVLLLFIATPASAITLFVDQMMGDDINDGLTQSTAVATVTAALNLAMEGDVVSVGPGLYSAANGETMPLRYRGAISIEGAGDELTIFDGENTAQVVSGFQTDTQMVRFASLAIINGDSAIGAGLSVGGAGIVEVENVRFEGNRGNIGGAFHIQINGDEDTQLTFSNCTFLDNAASIGPGIHIQQNGTGQHNVSIDRSEFRGQDRSSIVVSQNDGESILTLRSTLVEAGNSTAVAASQAQLAIINSTLIGSRQLVTAGDGLSVINSILVIQPLAANKGNANTTVISGSGGIIRDSIVMPLNVDGHTVGDNVLDVDPRLTASGRLSSQSPARDRGDDSVVVIGDLDIDGQPRIQGNLNAGGAGGLVDLGADEFDVLFISSFEATEDPG